MRDPGSSTASPWRATLQRHRAWLLVGLVVLFVLVVRVRLREIPLERDEGEYAYAGQLILEGVPPYQEVYNMKLPGTYAAYAVIMAVFGQSPAGIRLGLALVNVASIILVFRLGRRLLDEATGVAAAAAFALLSLSPSVLGLAAHATHFVVLAALGGIGLLLKALECPPTDRRLPLGARPSLLLLASGLLFGLAFLMKQPGLFFSLFGGIYLLWVRGGEWLAGAGGRDEQPGVRNPRVRTGFAAASLASRTGLTQVVRDLGCFGAGCLAPYGLMCLVLWLAGAFPQFVFWTITYAAEYASAVPLVNGPAMLRYALHAVVGPNLVLWLLPWVGVLVMWWDERLAGGSPKPLRAPHSAGRAPEFRLAHPRFFLMAFLVCSLGSISVGLYFREHYFITVLPVLALLAGVAVSRALHLLKHDQTIELFLALAILGLFAIALGAGLIGHGPVWLALPPNQALRSIFGSTLFAETARAADYLKSHTAPGARVGVLGSEPEIYFLARRRSASGFIYMYPLMETQPYALKMQEQMIGELERARPEYMVYVDDEFSWLARRGSEQRVLEWWNDYWTKNLDLVMTLEVEEAPERGTDLDMPAREAPTRKNILIFKRKH